MDLHKKPHLHKGEEAIVTNLPFLLKIPAALLPIFAFECPPAVSPSWSWWPSGSRATQGQGDVPASAHPYCWPASPPSPSCHTLQHPELLQLEQHRQQPCVTSQMVHLWVENTPSHHRTLESLFPLAGRWHYVFHTCTVLILANFFQQPYCIFISQTLCFPLTLPLNHAK